MSEPIHAVEAGARRVRSLTLWWWAAWLLATFVGRVEFRLAMSDDPANAPLATYVGIAGSLLNIAAGLLVMRVVRATQDRQLLKAQELVFS